MGLPVVISCPTGRGSFQSTNHSLVLSEPLNSLQVVEVSVVRITLHFDEVNSAEHWHLGFGIKCCHKNTVRRNHTVSAQRQSESVVCFLRGSDSPPGYVRLSLNT